MVQELRDRSGGIVCNTHLVGSANLNKLTETQKLQNNWRKINPEKIEFTNHRLQSNIHSRLDRIYASHNLHITNSEHSDHESLLTEFVLRARSRGPGYWKLNSSILEHELNYFCGMVDRRRALSLITSWDHCRRSSPSQISFTPQAVFEPAQNLSSSFVE